MTRALFWGLVVAIALLFVAPFPWLRLAAIAAILVLHSRSQIRVELPPALAFVAQVSIALCALGAAAVAFEPEHRALRVAMLALGAAAVALAGNRRVAFAIPAGEMWPVVAVAALGTALLAIPLDGPITWPNDELIHFLRLRLATELLARPAALAAGAIAGAAMGTAIGVAEGRRSGVVAAILFAPAAAAVTGALFADPREAGALAWYPALELWPQSALAANVAGAPRLAFAEGWSRLVPAASLVVAACALARGGWNTPVVRVLAAAVVVTAPALLHFGTLLYLEMPLVLLALAAILTADRARLPDGFAWLALAVLPFGKETTLPLVAAILAQRFLIIARDPGDLRSRALDLARVVAMAVVPFALVWKLRNPATSANHPFAPAPSHLVDPLYWATTARALFEQQPTLLALALPGAVLGWRRRRDATLAALLSLAAVLGFLALDEERYWGYARFELLLFPALAALALETARALPARLAVPLFAAALAANLAIVPYSTDGARRAWFGARLYAYGDLAYPWSDALERCAKRGGDVAVVGLAYGYRFDAYERKHAAPLRVRQGAWPQSEIERAFERVRADRPYFREPEPRDDPEETARLLEALDASARDGSRTIVVQLPPCDPAKWPERRSGYALAADLKLGSCRLLVYEKQP